MYTPAMRNDYAAEMGFEYDFKSPAAAKKPFINAGTYGEFAS